MSYSPPASGNRENSALQLFSEWEALLSHVPSGWKHDELGWISRATGIEFRSLDFVRHTRNRVAHADPSLRSTDIGDAINIIRRAQYYL